MYIILYRSSYNPFRPHYLAGYIPCLRVSADCSLSEASSGLYISSRRVSYEIFPCQVFGSIFGIKSHSRQKQHILPVNQTKCKIFI